MLFAGRIETQEARWEENGVLKVPLNLLLASIADEALKLLVGNANTTNLTVSWGVVDLRGLSARCVVEDDVNAALLDHAHD